MRPESASSPSASPASARPEIRTSDEFAAYQELAAAGELPVRVFTMMMIDDTLDALSRLGMRTGWGDAWLRIGPAKLFQDGSGGVAPPP